MPATATGSELVRVVLHARFAFPLRPGYDYIADLARWPEYWPGLVRVERGSRWSHPGDTARLTLRLLGRTRDMELTLQRMVPYRLVEYTSRQRGLPDARHERHFDAIPAGFAYGIVIAFDPRPGPRRPFDRLVVPRAVERAAARTIRNLTQRFSALPTDGSTP